MISIIIPLYKVEMYIKNCLLSLEKQSFKEFEVIIVNDGTPDKSAKIVEEYIESSSINIKLINQENQGVSVARNNGIKYSSGEYLCFIDSDDMLDTEYLATMYHEISEHDTGICICQNRQIKDDENRIFTFNGAYNSQELTKTQILEKLLYGEVSAGIWALMCKRSVLGSNRFAENFKYSEDLEMVWRLAASCNKTILIDAPLYCYRIRNGSAMTVMDDRRLDGLRLFENLSDFIKENAAEFYPQYEKYGVARWMWSSVWQEAVAADSYEDFCKNITKYNPDKYFAKLSDYKNSKVRISAFLYLHFKKVYYFAVKQYKKGYRKID